MKKKSEAGMMRIIAGKHRGRTLEPLPDARIRPTSGRTREALFNILSHGMFMDTHSPLVGKHVADIFCGTGALGLEALSRGAALVTMVDRHPDSLAVARRNVEKLKESEHVRLLRADARQMPRAGEPCSLAFVDPPYESGLAAPALASMIASGWLLPGAIAVVEMAERETLPDVPGFQVMDERRYGAAKVVLLKLVAN
ncbi:MAG: 16S rRNA (guanine(966)-N(2))-methyltransferase RsmD [Alphaproteobacteria bacterium]|nr:16S rRNA (guanine(966)-N(2))-methyltransferase RsmD [Alphaproteobacteria bacterium]